jgi:biofilm protein TabA
MIVDRLGNRSVDAYVPPRVRQALEYLRAANMAAAPVGRHELDGDRLYAIVQEYMTKPADQCAWEAHRRYVDVQYIVHGAERIGHAPLARSGERVPYDRDRDVTLYYPGSQYVTLSSGMLAIFGPDDVHSPGGAVDHPRAVRKVVMKAAIDD